jgi:hypothetical protein
MFFSYDVITIESLYAIDQLGGREVCMHVQFID